MIKLIAGSQLVILSNFDLLKSKELKLGVIYSK